ncbi:MAG: ethanolamine ammonia-lyase reactivating factor EutA [Rhizobiales bacterium]|nr:ethanolamine ammonia-lyase reactivating factor EutA [Hyphomicrobiales bacterium]
MIEQSNISDVDGGRIFFSGAGRSLLEEDEIMLTSVGVDIGSSTAHLMFSRITLERLDTRYIVTDREVLYASDILLTPYRDDGDIDTHILANFIEKEYAQSGVSRDDVDTGALILTGVAVRRRNARAIGELFAAEAGKFVSVSAGDRLETIMAAHGSGAVAASQDGRKILNIDIGGGTTKLAVCQNGDVTSLTAIEVGARLVVTDQSDAIIRLEEFGAQALGAQKTLGSSLSGTEKEALAQLMAERIMLALKGGLDDAFRRLPQLPQGTDYDGVIISGGVSEFFYNDSCEDRFGDLGAPLALALRGLIGAAGLNVLPHRDGIRATVVGASQYTVQVSGSTVYIDPLDVLPLRNIATIRPKLALPDDISIDDIAQAVAHELQLYDLDTAHQPVAIAFAWEGSASYARLDALSQGLVKGLTPLLDAGHPMIIVADGDIGGLLGMHCRENNLTQNPVVSIDGINLESFDFVDIGEVIRATGSVPVVIKSLIFPGETKQQKSQEAA